MTPAGTRCSGAMPGCISDNAYKPLAARTVSMTLKKHADEFGLEHDNHIQNALGKRVNGFWGIEALAAPPVL